MKKKYVTLDKKWKEILFASSGFGPNLLMILLGAYFTDAINPAAFNLSSSDSVPFQAISRACLILPAVFPILWMLAKIFDGIIDIPFASLTDNLKTKWGRRRPLIFICFIPMVISYVLCWFPIYNGVGLLELTKNQQIINTIWICFWALVFFATYTMCLIAFYGSLSTVCIDEKQRLRVSSFKSFFDTISYCLVYALVPVLLDAMKIHIDKFILLLIPFMATMIIPLFMIKEGDKFEKKAINNGYDIKPLAEEEKVGIKESLKLNFTNRPFMRWCLVNCCSFFGLQMFLVSMNALILGGMGLNGMQMAILNTCAFAPVPVMLYLFNKLKEKKGIRFAYQTCLISFAFCILSFDIASVYIMGEQNVYIRIIIGCIGGVIGSLGIGSFFMMPYMIPAQISAVEEKLTGKNHSAMYFATQAVLTSIVGAVASSLVYENLKMLFICKDVSGIVWAENLTLAAEKFNASESSVFNLGTLLVPIIVCIACIVGFVAAFKMPKDYTPRLVAKSLGLEKEFEQRLDEFSETVEKEIEEESLIINIALWILSGTIFSIIWRYGILKTTKVFKSKTIFIINWLISVFVFPYSGILCYKAEKEIIKIALKQNVKVKNCQIVSLIFGLFGLGIISYIIMQKQLNKISKTYDNVLLNKIEVVKA